MPGRPVVRAVALLLVAVAAGYLLVPTTAIVGSQRGTVSCGIPAPALLGVTPTVSQSDDELVVIAYGTSSREIARFSGSAGQALESIGQAAGRQLARAVREEAARECTVAATNRGITAGILAIGALGLVLLDLRRPQPTGDDPSDNTPDDDVPDDDVPVVSAP